MGQQEQPPTFFQQVFQIPGVEATYNEIVGETPPLTGAPVGAAPPADRESGSFKSQDLPCLFPEQPGCGDDYNGHFAYDMSADTTHVVGSVFFDNPTFVPTDPDDGRDIGRQMAVQAVVWLPDQQKFVLLEDESATVAYDMYAVGIGASSFEDRSAAFDITATSNVIVGTAGGQYFSGGGGGGGAAAPQDGDPESGIDLGQTAEWMLPILWTPSGANTWNVGLVLPNIYDMDDNPVGGAFAIDEEGKYIAGWNGELYGGTSDPYRFDDIEAVRWHQDGETWVPVGLGYIDEEEHEASIANDVNGFGHTVGWSGYLDNDDYISSSQQIQNILPGIPQPGWSPFPFVSVGPDQAFPDPVMMALSLDVDTNDEGTDFDLGEARAISANDKVAVGWVFRFNRDGTSCVFEPDFCEENAAPTDPQLAGFDPDGFVDLYGAAWINRGVEGPWDNNELVVLDTPDLVMGDPDTIESGAAVIGSVANAVDESGRLIVGKSIYIDGEDIGDIGTEAVFWELDEDFHVVRAESLEQALLEAGLPMDDPASNELFLTEATGVRMVMDENGNPTEVYVIGTGTGSFGSWVAALATPAGPGLTTPQSVVQSLAVAEQGARDAAEGFGYIAENQRCIRPEGSSVENEPWCYFVVGKGTLYIDSGSSGVQIGKNLGLAYFLDEDSQIGGSFGLDILAGQVPGGSSYEALVGSVGVYAAHEPEEGLRAVGSAVYGRILKATFNRVYVNGTGTATSTGTTTGQGFGLYGELGYGFALDEKTRVIPYVSASYSKVDLAGFTDSGGPFNATIAPIANSSIALSVGVKAEHDIDEDRMVYAILEASAIRHQGSGVNATIAATPFTVGAPNVWNGLVSATLGIKKEFDEHTNGFAQVTASSNFGGYFGVAIKGGFNRTF